jgi:tetratricopeptide (TPR) repeat protein
MKALLLSAAAALLIGVAPAQAGNFTIGSSFGEACYRAAENRDVSLSAREACDRALSTDEVLSQYDRAGTYVNRGILFMHMGHLDRANQDYDRALAIDPRLAEAWLNKGIAQMKAGNGRAALELAARSIELRTNRPAIAYYIRGLAHEQTGNIKAAYADLTRARALAPKWRDPAIELARYQVRNR